MGSVVAVAAAVTVTAACGARLARAIGPIDETFTAQDGLVGYYRLYAPDDQSAARPSGVLMLFHQDGGDAGYTQLADRHRDLAVSDRLMVIAVASPTETGVPPPAPPDSRCWWTPRVQRNARFIHELLDSLSEELGDEVDRDRFFFAGSSGGGDFAVAVNAHNGFPYRGGAVAVCGGELLRSDGGNCKTGEEPPLLDPAPDANDVPAGATSHFRYSIDITPDDRLRPLAEAARDYYRDLGFTVDYRNSPGGGHCAFDDDLDNVFRDRVEEMLAVPEAFGAPAWVAVLGAIGLRSHRVRRLRRSRR